jgi:hypothetical protein
MNKKILIAIVVVILLAGAVYLMSETIDNGEAEHFFMLRLL